MRFTLLLTLFLTACTTVSVDYANQKSCHRVRVGNAIEYENCEGIGSKEIPAKVGEE